MKPLRFFSRLRAAFLFLSALVLMSQASAATSLVLLQNPDGSVTLTWDANAAVEGVTKYTMYRSTGGTTFTKLADITAPTVTFKTPAIPCFTTHSFRVTATNAAGGESGPSNVVAVTNSACAPSAPKNLRLAPSSTGGQALLEWDDSPGATLYRVELLRRGEWEEWQTSNTSLLISGAGRYDAARVSALASSGWSEASDPIALR